MTSLWECKVYAVDRRCTNSVPAQSLFLGRADVHCDGSGDIAIRTRVSATLFADLLLDIHEALLDPAAEMRVRAHRIRVQHLGEGGFYLLVDFAELVRVFNVCLRIETVRHAGMCRDGVSGGVIADGRP